MQQWDVCKWQEKTEAILKKYENVVFPDSRQDIEKIFQDVKSAVNLLHKEGYVFADLRLPNILAVKNHTEWRGMLVDFDWCGMHDKDKYPLCMNLNINWAPNVQHGATLQKEHDLYFLEYNMSLFDC